MAAGTVAARRAGEIPLTMRILHLVHQFPPETHGGLESSVLDLARAQARRGDAVEIVAGSLEGRPQVEVTRGEVEGLAVTRIHRDDLYFDMWDKGAHPGVARALLGEVGRFRPDLVHLHHWIRLTQDAAALVSAAGVPVVATLHDFASSCPRAFRMRVPDDVPCALPVGEESCLRCAPRWPWMSDEDVARELRWFARNGANEMAHLNAVLCASPAVVDVLTTGGAALPAGRVHVVPPPYAPRFEGVERAEVDDRAPFRFGYWGSVTERKGVIDLVTAFVATWRARPDGARGIELHVFGRFDLDELEQRVRAAAADAPVTFHGRFAFAQLAAAGLSAAVFPSRCIETHGLVLDEAFELGLPVVVPDLGALGARAGAAGLRFRPHDVADLAARLAELADDPSCARRLRASLPAAGPTLDEHVAGITAIYAAAIAEGPVAPDAEAALDAGDRALQAFERAESMLRGRLEGR